MDQNESVTKRPQPGWESLFRPHILARGEDYYLNGAVGSFTRSGDVFSADVEGSRSYAVSIRLEDGGRIADMRCTCPYAEDGNNCKHMAAVLYALEESGAPEKRKGGAPSITELIGRLSPQEMRAMLEELAREDEMLAMRIRLRAAGELSTTHLEDIRSAIYAVGQKASGRQGYIDYEHAWDYIVTMEEYLDQFARSLMERGMLMEAFELAGYVFMEAGRRDIDDSDGGLAYLCEACTALWEDLAKRASEAEQMSMYRWFEKACGDPALMDYMTDTLEEAQLRVFHVPKLVRQNLAAIDRKIQELRRRPDNSWRSGYRLSELVLRRLSLMEESGASQEEIAAFKKEYFHLSAMREHEIAWLLEEGRIPEAIALLQKSKELDRELPGLVSRHSERLIELHQKRGDEAALREELEYQVFHCYQRELAHIQELKSLTPETGWADARERFLASRTAGGVRLLLLQSEGLYERLLEAVISAKSLECMDQFESDLRCRYPRQVSGFYVERLTEEMAGAGKRSEYARLIAYLKKLRRYPEGPKTARDLADCWRRTYPRRRSMLDELGKAGY